MCGNLTSRIIWFLTPLFPSAQVIYGRKTFFGIFHPIFSFNIIWAKWAKLISELKIIFGAKISNKIILFFCFSKTIANYRWLQPHFCPKCRILISKSLSWLTDKFSLFFACFKILLFYAWVQLPSYRCRSIYSMARIRVIKGTSSVDSPIFAL
mgnify:CR=1 FL=1